MTVNPVDALARIEVLRGRDGNPLYKLQK